MFRVKQIENSITEYVFSFRLNEKRFKIVRILFSLAVLNDILLCPTGSFTLPYPHFFSLFSLFNETVGRVFSFCVLLSYAAGFFPLITSILFFWVCYSLRCAEYAANGGNNLVMILSCLMIPFSFHSLRNKNNDQLQFSINSLLCLSILFVRLQISIVYFFSAWSKLKDVTWRDGTAIFFWANEPYSGWPNWMDRLKEYFFQYPLSSVILAWTVIIFEFCIAFAFLFSDRIKNKIFISAIWFHILIAILHGLVSFSLIMIGALILFIRPLNKEEEKITSYK
jgi:antimicrobial peptide system SdpB family protein